MRSKQKTRKVEENGGHITEVIVASENPADIVKGIKDTTVGVDEMLAVSYNGNGTFLLEIRRFMRKEEK